MTKIKHHNRMLSNKINAEPANGIVERQADDFITNQLGSKLDTFLNVKERINEIRQQLYEYTKDPQKLVFLERIRYLVKLAWDYHLSICQHSNSGTGCPQDLKFEDFLFFLQNEIDGYSGSLDSSYLKPEENEKLSALINQILDELSILKTTTDMTYVDLLDELTEIKGLYFLKKKTLSSMITGKLAEMVAAGVVSETVSKGIIDGVVNHYDEIIQALK